MAEQDRPRRRPHAPRRRLARSDVRWVRAKFVGHHVRGEWQADRPRCDQHGAHHRHPRGNRAAAGGAGMKLSAVIRRPLVTEKTTIVREIGPTLVFEVARDATKIDVKHAVEKLFGSKVESVRTQIAHGKFKRQGRFEGQRPDWKKAWVRLRAGEKVPEIFEGT